tara:strand:+ start:87 stop:977 length:891 start_codon:yes stop_codon:yes gene_type:complete
MANKKFSQFTAKTNLDDFSGLVGFESTALPFSGGANDNYYITKANFYTDLLNNLSLSNFTTGTLPVSRGGTGNTSFATGFVKASGTSNFGVQSSIDLSGSDVSNVLAITNGGTGSANTWKAVQQFVWEGTSTAYNNIPNATDVVLPFNSTPIIDQSNNTAGATKWVISTTPSGLTPPAPANESAFTLGNNGGGIWRVDVLYPSFNLINFVQARLSLDINGTIIPLYSHDYTTAYGSDPNFVQSMAGSLTQNFSGNDVVKVQLRIDGAGGNGPFPGGAAASAPWDNRPPEITFTRVI